MTCVWGNCPVSCWKIDSLYFILNLNDFHFNIPCSFGKNSDSTELQILESKKPPDKSHLLLYSFSSLLKSPLFTDCIFVLIFFLLNIHLKMPFYSHMLSASLLYSSPKCSSHLSIFLYKHAVLLSPTLEMGMWLPQCFSTCFFADQ